jgi:putative heme-binding domain-containing protein
MARIRRSIGAAGLVWLAAIGTLSASAMSRRPDGAAPLAAAQQMGPQYSEQAQCGAIRALDFADRLAAAWLLERWLEFAPAVRQCAFDAVIAHPNGTATLLSALEAHRIPGWTITPRQRQLLMSRTPADARQRARQILGETITDAALRARYPAACGLRGDVDRGSALFDDLCAHCHRLGQTGNSGPGPDLTVMDALSATQIVRAIVSPSDTIAEPYQVYVIDRVKGPRETGMLRTQTDDTVTVRGVDNVTVVLRRAEIARMRAATQSFMPAGLDQLLNPDQMADLVTFVVNGRRVVMPTALVSAQEERQP